jgi:ATP-dependent protease ClpP protease subunit
MSWFKFEAKAEEPAAVDLLIYDVIGDWIDDIFGFDGVTTAKSFTAALAEVPENVKTIRVRINSPGGDVFGAAAIANALRNEQLSKGRKVETYVDGLAASAASVIAMAGSKVTMADNALMMVHNPWTAAVGNPAELRKAAETLDGVRDTIIATYQWHSPLDAKEIGKLMDEETWMSADEAIANGFADAKVEGLSAAASIDPRAASRVIRIPEAYASRVAAWLKPAEAPAAEVVPAPEPVAVVEPEPVVEVEPEPEPEIEAPAVKDVAVLTVKIDVDSSALDEAIAKLPPGRIEPVVEAELLAEASEIVRACAENKLSVEFITATVAASPTREGLAARIAAEVERVSKDATRADAIRAMFGKYNMAKIGEGLVAAGVSVEAAGKILTDIKAQRDSVAIDGTLPTSVKQNVLSYTEIYARLNGVAK